jgi:hypothetical protein
MGDANDQRGFAAGTNRDFVGSFVPFCAQEFLATDGNSRRNLAKPL